MSSFADNSPNLDASEKVSLLERELILKNELIKDLKSKEVWLSSELKAISDEKLLESEVAKDENSDENTSKEPTLEGLLTKPNLSPSELAKARTRIFHTLSHFHRELVKAKAIINHNSKAIVHAELRKGQAEEEANYFRQLLEQVQQNAEKNNTTEILQGFKLLEKDRTKKLRVNLESSQAEILSLQEKLSQIVQYAKVNKDERINLATELQKLQAQNAALQESTSLKTPATNRTIDTNSFGTNTSLSASPTLESETSLQKIRDLELQLKQAKDEIDELVEYQVQAQNDIDNAVSEKNAISDESASLRLKAEELAASNAVLKREVAEMKKRVASGPAEPSVVRSSSLNSLQASRQADELLQEIQTQKNQIKMLESDLVQRDESLHRTLRENAEIKARDQTEFWAAKAKDLEQQIALNEVNFLSVQKELEIHKLTVKELSEEKVAIEAKQTQINAQLQLDLDTQLELNTDLENSIRNKCTDVEEKEGRIKELELTVSQLQVQAGSHLLKLTESDRTLEEYKRLASENATTNQQLLDTHSLTLQNITAAHSAAKDEYELSLSKVKQELDSLQLDVTTATDSLALSNEAKCKLEKEVADLKLSLQQLKQDYEVAEGEKDVFNEAHKKLDADYQLILVEHENLKSEKESVLVRCTKLEGESDALKNRIQQQSAQLLELSEQLRVLESENDTFKLSNSEQIDLLTQEKALAERKLKELSAQYVEAETNLKTLQDSQLRLSELSEKLQHDNEQLNNRILKLEDENSNLNSQLCDYALDKNANEKLSALVQSNLEEKERYQIQIKEFATTIDSLNNQKRELEQVLASAEDQGKTLREKISILEASSARERELAESQLKSKDVEHSQELSRLQSLLDSAMNEKDSLSNAHEKMVASLNSGSEEKMQVLLNERESFVEQNKQLEKSINILRAQIAQMDETSREVHAHNLDMEKTLVDLTTDNEDLEKQIEILSNENKSLTGKWEAEMQTRETLVAKLEERLQTLEKDKNYYEKQLADIQESHHVLEAAHSSLKSETESKAHESASAYAATLKDLQENIGVLESKIVLLKSSNEEADSLNKHLQEKLLQTEAKLEAGNSTQTQFAALSVEHNNLQDNMKLWEAKCAELQASLETAQQKSKKAAKEQQKLREKLEKDVETLQIEKKEAIERSKELNDLLKEHQERLLHASNQYKTDNSRSSEYESKYEDSLAANKKLKSQITDLEEMNKELLGRFKGIAEELDAAKRRTLQKGGTIQAANAEAMESLLRKLGDHEDQMQELRDLNDKLKEENVTLNVRLMEMMSAGNPSDSLSASKSNDKLHKATSKGRLFSDIVAGNNSETRPAK